MTEPENEFSFLPAQASDAGAIATGPDGPRTVTDLRPRRKGVLEKKQKAAR